MTRSLLAVLILAVFSSVGPPGALAYQASTPTPIRGDFSGFIELPGGRQIFAECAGAGGPVVLLVSGYRTRGDVWTDERLGPGDGIPMVLPAVASQTRVCTYDRPGTLTVLDGERLPSRSDPTPMPRKIEDVVAELYDVKQLLAGEEPVVLVGHSLGGAIVRLFAATYPSDVAGIVLVDAYSEFVEAHMPPDAFAAYARYASEIPDFLADYTDYETVDFASAAKTLSSAARRTPLLTTPYFVLSKGQPFGLQGQTPGFTIEQLETAWASAQDDLAALQSGAPHFTVSDSSHYIQLQRPELVAAAIMQIVDEVRLATDLTP
jgi:pimeloyl-ACP methyl ester carboxylesterase